MDNKTIKSYRDLLVWQKGIELAKDIYALTKSLPPSEKFGLISQMRRAAVFVPSNIAEGQARRHTKEFRQFLHIARGSLAELDTQLTVAVQLGFVAQEDVDLIGRRLIELAKMTNGLLSKLSPDYPPNP